MTTTQTVQDKQIAAYLSSLASHLAPMTLAEREDILREIGAHIRDSAETGTPTETVLVRLGTPEELAFQYRNGALIRAASRSFSPLLLLQATLKLTTRGIVRTLVFFAGLTGYCMAIGLFLMGVLKPFFPAHIGLWLSQSTTTWTKIGNQGAFGIRSQTALHEILGWWTIPIGIVGGALAFVVTTWAMRHFLRFSRVWQTRLTAS